LIAIVGGFALLNVFAHEDMYKHFLGKKMFLDLMEYEDPF